jgi:hypothetical protein
LIAREAIFAVADAQLPKDESLDVVDERDARETADQHHGGDEAAASMQAMSVLLSPQFFGAALVEEDQALY